MNEQQMTRDALREAGFEQLDTQLSTLISCLGDAMQGLGEDELLRYLPWKNNAKIEPGKLPKNLQRLYSLGFELLNMVEERVASSVRREREKVMGAASVRGLWERALVEMKDMGLGDDEILKLLPDVHVESVLTAHPTEAKRSTVRECHRAIYEELSHSEHSKFTPRETARIQGRITTSLESLWRTGEIHQVRPNLEQELRTALYYLEEIFPKVVPRLNVHLVEAWGNVGFDTQKLRASRQLPRLTFATWIGGDRDGHPLVTPEVTQRHLGMLRKHAFLLMRVALKELAFHLSLSRQCQEPTQALTDRIDAIAAELSDREWVHMMTRRHQQEPWRLLVHLMRGKVFENLSRKPGAYLTASDLDSDLELIEDSLREAGCMRLIDLRLRSIREKVNIFGFHLAGLDIRQNSAYHDKAVSQLLVAAGIERGGDFANWTEEKRCEFLSRELDSTRPFVHGKISVGEEADSVLKTYRVLSRHMRKFGRDGIGVLIISMTRSLSDLLCVYLLAREAGLMEMMSGGLACPLEIVPLFETMDDLEASPRLLDAFLSHPATKRSMKLRSVDGGTPSQQVMLGYSDSNKDCGILSAQWALFRAQDAMRAVGEDHGIQIHYFHGRGGTISRGAGPTNAFMAALPHGSFSGTFRMTEQGETIAQKYANMGNATYHSELLVASSAETLAKHRYGKRFVDPCVSIMDTLATFSQTSYQSLIESDGFIEFYRSATPIDALENSRIGSRPPRRTGKKGFTLDDLRAIPWVFSWTQARFYLPGWFGVGSALEKLATAHPTLMVELRDALPKSPFLKYVFTNVETNLASANLPLMKAYAGLVEDADLRELMMGVIVDEFERTRSRLADIFQSDLSVRRPRMVKMLSLREEPLQVLHLQQVALLRQWRELIATGKKDEADALFPEIQTSIAAISAGLRTTG